MGQGKPYSPLTVAAALEEEALADACLIAGARGLSRRVSTVGVLDVQDLDGVRADQFVLSSAYPLLGLDLVQLVERLDQASICALGVKTTGYWERMPPELSATAETLDLPLLQLPPGPFDDLVNPLLAVIADRQAEILRRSGELHAALTRAALAEADLGAVAVRVARALGRPTVIVGERGDVLADDGSGIVSEAPELSERARALGEVGVMQVGGREALVAPISALGRFYGAICVFGGGPPDAFLRSAVTQAAVVSGMLLVGQRHVAAVHRRFERELLDDLIDRRLDPEVAADQARRIGWRTPGPYAVVVAGRRRESGGALGPALELGVGEDALPAFTRSLRGLAPDVRILLRRPGPCIVVHLDHEQNALSAADEVVERLAATPEIPWAATRLVAGVARPRTNLLDLADAFREAALTALIAPRLRMRRVRVEHFTNLGAPRLVAQIADREALEAIAAEALGPLGDPALPGRDELIETLAVLLDHRMSIAGTAGELFFHYNTVRHRLGRLRELLGERLSTPTGRTSLGLAVAALRVIAAVDSVRPLERQLLHADAPR